MSEELFTLIIGIIVAAVLTFVYLRVQSGRTRSGGGVGGLASVFRKPRVTNLMIGLSGSGKTNMFLRLIGVRMSRTNASMRPNKGYMIGSKELVVDYPGHRRLRGELYTALQEAKRLIVVVDSITIQDDRTEGAAALADLLYDVLQSVAFDGVQEVLFACTKRDDVTSFGAKAVRKVLEVEMARQLTTRGAGVGSIEKVAGVKELGKKSASERSDECVLSLREDGKFSFDDLRAPCTFVDASSRDKDKFNLKEVKCFIKGSRDEVEDAIRNAEEDIAAEAAEAEREESERE